MLLKCLRCFCQAFFHGIFINQNLFQLSFLIMLDIFIIISIAKLRQCFCYKLSFILAILYFIMFLSLDIFLLFYTLISHYFNTDFKDHIIYNFICVIIVFTLSAITALRIIIVICASIYRSIRHLFNNSKILHF